MAVTFLVVAAAMFFFTKWRTIDGMFPVILAMIALTITATQMCLAFADRLGFVLPLGIAALISLVLLFATFLEFKGGFGVPKRPIHRLEWVGIAIVIVGVFIAGFGADRVARKLKAEQSVRHGAADNADSNG